MVGDQDESLRKQKLHQPVWPLRDLTGDRRIATDPYQSRAPPVRHGRDQETKRLLCQRHIRVK